MELTVNTFVSGWFISQEFNWAPLVPVGEKSVVFLSWLKGLPGCKIKINQLTPSPSSLPHLPSPLTSLSSHVPPLSRPSPLTSLPSHTPLLSNSSHLTSLPSHTPPISHPSPNTSLPSHTLPSHIPPLSHPFPPKTFQGDPNLHKLDFYAEKDAFFLYARADDTTKVYVSAQAVG